MNTLDYYSVTHVTLGEDLDGQIAYVHLAHNVTEAQLTVPLHEVDWSPETHAMVEVLHSVNKVVNDILYANL